MERTIVIRNMACATVLQIATIISGFVVPRIILTYFGSNVNGLISSIEQFLNYIQLLEGGLSGVIMAALYKPLNENDKKKISGIIKATEIFFRRIAVLFCAYTVIVAIVYPLLFNTGFSFIYSAAMVTVLGANLFIQYFFSLTFKLLLDADRKGYLISITQTVIILLNTISAVVCTKYFRNILVVKALSALVFIIQPIVYGTYVKKHYCLDNSVEPDNKALSQRWDGFGINLAYFIHTNTDVIILTFLSTLANVSIYSVYLMIVNAMKNLVISISGAITPSLGKILSSGNEKLLCKYFDLYEFGMDFITTFIFTCGLVLITPFVAIYTKGITDADYIQYVFGYLLVLAEMIYCLRDPYLSITYCAGHFKQMTKYAVVEVIVNLAVSLALVRSYGIVGVAAGTLISMVYRMMAHIFYLKRNILHRKPWMAIKRLLMYGLISIVCFTLCSKVICRPVNSYFEWFVLALEIAVIVLIIDMAISLPVYRYKFGELLWNRNRK